MCWEQTVEDVDGKKMKMTREDGQRNHISPMIRHHHSTIESSYIGKEQQKERPTELKTFFLHAETFDRGLQNNSQKFKSTFQGYGLVLPGIRWQIGCCNH